MKYLNGAEVLPQHLLNEIQKYIDGELLYIPSNCNKKTWGQKTGARLYYVERNKMIKRLYKQGQSFEQLSYKYGLAYDTIKKIVYTK